jgi:flagellar basal body-associated protein FliL
MEILTIAIYVLLVMIISGVIAISTIMFFILPLVNHISKKMKEQTEKEFNNN